MTMHHARICSTCQTRPCPPAHRDLCHACYWRAYRARKNGRAAPAPTNNHSRAWTPDEDTRLLYLIQHEPIERIARTMGRTVGALQDRLYRKHGLSVRTLAQRAAGMSAPEVATALGVRQGHTAYWASVGVLPARRVRGVERSFFSIDPDALTIWLYRGGALYDLQPDPIWREIVADARAFFLARFVSRRDLAGALCVSKSILREWERKRGFPAPQGRRIGARGGMLYYPRRAVADWLRSNADKATRAALALVSSAPPSDMSPDGRCMAVERGCRCERDATTRGYCAKHQEAAQ